MIMEKIKESYVKKTNSRVPEILAPLGILLGSCSACSTIPSWPYCASHTRHDYTAIDANVCFR